MGTLWSGRGGWALGEYRVFDRVLTADEIAAIYSLGKPLTDTGAFSTPVINARDVRIPYGHTYGNEIAWAQASAVQNTWYDISDADMVSGNLNLVTHDGNGQLTVLVAGMYNVDWAGAFEASSAGVHVQITVAVNGTEDVSAMNHFRVGRYPVLYLRRGIPGDEHIIEIDASMSPHHLR